ncbi:MAG: alpha-mannosidase [Fibrobacterota bacterium]
MYPDVLDKTKIFLKELDKERFVPISGIDLEYSMSKKTDLSEKELKFRKIKLPFAWGKLWHTGYFRGKASVPKEASGKELFLQGFPGGETVVLVNGVEKGALDARHKEIMLSKKAKAGERYSFFIESYAGHPLPGIGINDSPSILNSLLAGYESRKSLPLYFKSLELVVKNSAVDTLFYDMSVLYEAALQIDEKSPRKHKIIRGLASALNIMHYRKSADWEKLAPKASAILSPLLKKKNSETVPSVCISGHSHLDIAWLWLRAETTRKFRRTFSTILNLMERYPEFNFLQSQSYIYETVRDTYPELFKRIQKAVKDGRWEPNAAMWVEADCNLSGGESLARQLLIGKRTIMEMFGYEPDTLLLPDVFGYSAALPQLLQKAGVRYFITAKIGWNDTNRFPYMSFVWKGVDGSDVTAHLIGSGNYNGEVRPKELSEIWANNKEAGVVDEIFYTVGYGDGGGGPTEEHNEYYSRMKNLEGVPKVKYDTLSAFMKRLENNKKELPVYDGELYLEFHRGTLTSQSYIKRFNRRLEGALLDTEFICSSMLPENYPSEEILKTWKTLLTNQFHDIIPGSSIEQVNVQAVEEYKAGIKEMNDFAQKAVDKASRKDSKSLSVINTISFPREEIVRVEAKASGVKGPDGNSCTVQKVRENGNDVIYFRGRFPGMSPAVFTFSNKSSEESDAPFKYKGGRLETPFYKVNFDKSFCMVSLFDKEQGRQIAVKGRPLNDIRYSDDVTRQYVAWDIERDYMEKETSETRLAEAVLDSCGPLFCRFRVKRPLASNSSLTQYITFYAFNRRIDFKTTVDWDEKNTLLRAGFPVDIKSSRAKFEIQYGYMERSAVENNSFEQAQFETAAQKWCDFSEPDFGVALLNDCKYGHRIKHGEISISLLKSSDRPDARCEKGVHEFTYSLFPHKGEEDLSDIIRESYCLNRPCRVFAGRKIKDGPLFESSSKDALIESVKLAEDGSGDYILRCYMPLEKRGTMRISSGRKLKSVKEADLLERPGKKAAVRGNSFDLSFLPFEIKTVRVTLAEN